MPHITCSVATKGRYHSTLAACLQSIISQTRTPDSFILIDDNTPDQRIELSKDNVLAPLLSVLNKKVKGSLLIIMGPNKGPQHNHEAARTHSKELVWRVDDDECPMPDVLEKLEKFFIGKDAKRTGAACGCVHGPSTGPNPYANSSIPMFRGRKTVQWFTWPEGTVFDNIAHIHSTYLYRTQAGTFDLDLSPVGHTEETRHTVAMKMMGFNLYFDASAVTMHYRQPHGGIRQGTTGDMTVRDEVTFNRYLDSLPVDWVMPVDFIANQGVGDAFALRKALPEILPQYEKGGYELRLFARKDLQPIFEDIKDRLDIFLPISDADLFNVTDTWCIYNHMSPKKLKGLDKAYVDYYNSERVAS